MTGHDQRQASRPLPARGFLKQRLLRRRDLAARLSDPQGSAKFPERPLQNLESIATGLTPGPAAGGLGSPRPRSSWSKASEPPCQNTLSPWLDPGAPRTAPIVFPAVSWLSMQGAKQICQERRGPRSGGKSWQAGDDPRSLCACSTLLLSQA